MARPTTMIFSRGDAVQTSLGKGVVQDVRNNGRLLVDLRGRAVEVAAASVTRPGGGTRLEDPDGGWLNVVRRSVEGSSSHST
jgi:hypothetical protein